MYTKALKEAVIGKENNTFSPSDYNSLHAARTVLKRKPEFADWNWTIKLGGGKVVLKRTS